MAVGSGLSAQIGMAEEVYTNEVQRISGTPSGTFGLTFDGANTAVSLTTTASAASIQTALNALGNIGTGGVSCTGGPLPTAVDITFSGPLVGKRNVPALAVQGAITGLTFSTTTPGTGYGDGVTATRFLEFTDESLKLNVDRIESAALRTGTNVLRTDHWAANKKGVAGDVNWEVCQTGYGLLLKHMFGTSVISTPTNGVLTRDHTYTFSDLYQARSLTMQLGVPDTNGTVNPFTYKGCKIAAWELSSAVDGMLMLKTTLDAQDEDQSTGLASASYPSNLIPLTFVGGTISNSSLGNWSVRNLAVSADRGLKQDRYFIRNSTLKKEPINNAFMSLGVQVEAEMESTAAYNLYVNGTNSSITATWVGAQIEAVTPTYFYQLSLTIPNVRFDGESPDVSGPDVVTQTMTGEVLYDGTNSPITAVYRTTDTTD